MGSDRKGILFPDGSISYEYDYKVSRDGHISVPNDPVDRAWERLLDERMAQAAQRLADVERATKSTAEELAKRIATMMPQVVGSPASTGRLPGETGPDRQKRLLKNEGLKAITEAVQKALTGGASMTEIRHAVYAGMGLADDEEPERMKAGDPKTDLNAFIAWLHAEIHKSLQTDGHCKRYEGEVDLEVAGALDAPCVKLTLRMYLFAPSGREHEWTGATVAEVVGKAHADCAKWIADHWADE